MLREVEEKVMELLRDLDAVILEALWYQYCYAIPEYQSPIAPPVLILVGGDRVITMITEIWFF